MSISPESPSSQPPSEGPRNPKAEAKAARAYKKAMRPWYKKKRVLVPAGFVALMMAVSIGQNMGNPASSTATAVAEEKSETKPAKSKEKAAKSKDKIAKVGQTVTNAGTTYKVTTAKTTKTIGDPDFLGERADGVFVVVSLQLTNNKDETKTFMDSSAKLTTADGKEYETSDKAVMAFGDDSLMLKDIQPDLTTRGKLAFEIPPSKTSGSTLVIEDLWGSGEIKVDLEL